MGGERTAASQTCFILVPKATLETLRAYGEDLFRAIFGLELDCGKLWRSKSLGAGVNQPEDPWEVRERLLYRLVLRVPKATAYGEDLFRAIFGLELDCGKLWRSKSLGAGVNQPEDPWEVRERLFRGFRGVSVTAGGLKRG